MEPIFRSLIVGLVPQPTQIPPMPFKKEDLQRLFLDITEDYSYQQFGFLPADAGAQLVNTPDDIVLVQNQLIQVQAPVATQMSAVTRENAREKVVQIMKRTAKRLGLENFLQGGIKTVANVALAPPMQDARLFVAQRLLRMGDAVESELGPGFFSGGVKFRNIASGTEQNLLIEPFVQDNTMLWLDYDIQRMQPFSGLDSLAQWIDEALDFVEGPAMKLLEVEP